MNLVLITENEIKLEKNLNWKENNITYLNGEKFCESVELVYNKEFSYLMSFDEYGYNESEGNDKNKYTNNFLRGTDYEMKGPVYITKCNTQGDEIDMTEEDIKKILNILGK